MNHTINKLPNKRIEDLTGKNFGIWNVVGYAGSAADFGASGAHAYWVCVCLHCGEDVIVRSNNIKGKTITTCRGHKSPTKHHLFAHWSAMIQRCEDKNQKHYHRYGGRGISVCDRWRNDFWKFVEDMGERPNGNTVDRIDNNRGYSPSNCRWSSRKEQARNTSRNRYVTHNGETLCLTEWASRLGLSPATITTRINVSGWCDTCAVTKPKFSKCEHR